MNTFNKRTIDILFFLLILLWCVGILWEIVINYFPTTFYFIPFLKYNYSIVCHTEPEKLFTIGKFHTLVCSRCTGIYYGGLISSIIIIFGAINKINTKLLLLSSIPMLLDVTLYTIGIYNYSKYIALFTGLLLGSVGFIYIHCAIIELLNKQKGKN